jgi:hypothetical protein
VRHLQPVLVPQPGRVVADPDPDEREPAVRGRRGSRTARRGP